MNLLVPILGLLGVSGAGIALAFIPGAMGVVANVASGAVNFLGKVDWAKLWWLLIVIPAVAYGLYERHERHKVEKKIPALEQRAANSHAAFVAEKKAFAIEKASLDQARGIIGENNRRILAGAADLDRAKKDAAAADARNAKLARSTDARIAALQAASHQHTKPCVLSGAAKQELGNQ